MLFSLVAVFILSSGCLFCINVEFLALVFVMVYVGAIIVLFLFAVMLLNFRISATYYVENFIVIIFFLFSYIYTNLWIFLSDIEEEYISCKLLSNVDLSYVVSFCVSDTFVFKELYTTYGLLLILVALILLIVMVGSISICLSAKEPIKSKLFKKF